MKIAEIHTIPVKIGTSEGEATAKITSISPKIDKIDFYDYEWIFGIGNPKDVCVALRSLADGIENIAQSR